MSDAMNVDDAREEMIIGRALHALDRVERDVADDDEVREYLEVLSHMPFDEVPPPAALEDRVVNAAYGVRRPGVPSLVARRRRTTRLVVLGSAAAVAAAMTFVVIADNGTHTTSTRVEHVSASRAVLQGRPLKLQHDGQTVATLRVGDKGIVALENSLLEPSNDNTTYWLWISGADQNAIVDKLDDVNQFKVVGSMTGAFITAEPTGVTPQQPGRIVARGELP
jgi:hypothetical protein